MSGDRSHNWKVAGEWPMRRKKCRTGAPVIAPAYEHVRVEAQLVTVEQKKVVTRKSALFKSNYDLKKALFIFR